MSCVQSCRSTQEYRARKTLTKDSDKKNQVRYYVTFWYLIRVCKCNLKRYGNCSAIFILFDFLALYFVIDTIYRQEELLWYNSSQKILVLFLISRHLSVGLMGSPLGTTVLFVIFYTCFRHRNTACPIL